MRNGKDIDTELRKLADSIEDSDVGRYFYIPVNKTGIEAGYYNTSDVVELLVFLADMLE